jgi:parallel beta-helix repeat protein
MKRSNNRWKKKLMTAVLAAAMTMPSALVPAAYAAEPSPELQTKLKDAIVLYVNSPDALSHGKKQRIDPDNPGVRAIVKDGSTLVPVRFVSEQLGAEVKWDDKESRATIVNGKDTIQVAIHEKSMRVNESIKELEVPAQLIDGRTMVPLRAIAEALGRKVFWDPMGLIVISREDRFFDGEKDAGALEQTADLFNSPLPLREAVASVDDGNVPENTLDGSLETRWSGQGDGEWIRFDLGEKRTMGYAAIAFYSGDQRQSFFDLEVSDDGVSWRQVFSGKSSGKSLEPELFDFDDTAGRYIRVLGHGNSKNAWNSISEFQVYAPGEGNTIRRITAAPPEAKPDVKYALPGLINPDGKAVSLHAPNRVTGKTLNVLDYGADIKDNDTDDLPAIQKAIAAAKPGDEVYLPNGVYNLRSTLPNDKSANIELKSGVNLRGESQEQTILISSIGAETPSGKMMKAYSRANIVVSGMTLTSTWNGKYSSDTKEANPDKGGPQYLIYITDSVNKPSSNITIDGVTFEKFERMAVRIEKSSHVVVKNSLFRNATDVAGGGAGYGVSIQGLPKNDRTGYANDTYFNVVENNTFQGPYIRHGALIQYYAHNNVIRNNTFLSTQLDAIDLHGEDEYLNEIYGNKIRDIVTGAGIGVGNTGGSAPSNHDASGPGNYIHNNTITGSREGIKVHMGSPDTVIENNTISDSKVADGKGIYLQNAPRTLVRGNTITGLTGEGSWGIMLEEDPGDKNTKDLAGKGSPKDIQLIGNKVTGNANGVQIGATSTGIILKDNEIKDNKGENVVDLQGTSAGTESPGVEPSAPPATAAPAAASADGVIIASSDVEADRSVEGNLGTENRMRLKRSGSGTTARIGYFKFEVNDAEQVRSAELRLSAMLTPSNADDAKLEYEVYGLTDDTWQENELTWKNAPNHGDKGEITGVGESAILLGTITLSEKIDKTYKLDVTSFVQSQTDGVITLMIADNKGQNGNIALYTKEKGDAELQPALLITK